MHCHLRILNLVNLSLNTYVTPCHVEIKSCSMMNLLVYFIGNIEKNVHISGGLLPI
jgi:hypothetical protein